MNDACPMKSSLLIVLVGFSTALFGQTGNYFLSHYAPSDEQLDYVCFDIAQDTKGVMYFANKSGVLEFDGRDWDLIQSNSAVYSLLNSPSGELYWGGAKGFGKIGVDDDGFQQLTMLSESSATNVFQTLFVEDKVYFLSEDVIYILDEKTRKISRVLPASPENTFLRFFELFGSVYVNSENGILKIEQGKLVPTQINITGEVIFFSRIDNNYVIGTEDNKIYSCGEDLQFRPVTLKDQAYIDASVIVSGSWLNRHLLALGTLRGGVIFVNPLNGLTQEFMNYATGLPDNEVFELMTDVDQNVWVAHDYGFTKIAPYIPLRSFSHYQGLEGNLLCAYSFQETVYVGTSLGLFKLDKVDIYDELVTYVDVEVKRPKTISPPKTVSPKEEPVVEPPKSEPKEEIKVESKKRGLFNFLKRNKNKNKAVEVEVEEEQKEEAKQSTGTQDQPSHAPAISSPTYRKEKRIQKFLLSSQYVFKKVRGIDAKIVDLVEVKGRLLASGLGGLFEIDKLLAKPILEEPIRYVFAPANRNIVIVSTYNNEVRTIRLEGKTIENISLLSNLDDQIQYAFEGKENELWLCGVEKIYRAELNGNEVNHKQTIPLMHRNTDRTAGAVLNGEIFLANAQGFYHFNRQNSVIEKLDSLLKPSQYFAHKGTIVYRDRHGWNLMGSANTKNGLQLLNVFRNLRFIASDKDPKNLWLISGGNELYKFFGDKITPYKSDFPVFLKSVVTQDKRVGKVSEITMEQEHTSLKFEVVRPDYINSASVEFRYFLNGLNLDWSEWSNDNLIEFPYLPPGEYTLQVESRNIFGKINGLEALSFEVLPPYWKRSWFYALEFAVFSFLVLLSFRLSTRYRIVSRLLSLLTIILLIQFIQTAVGSTILTQESPVIDFFIQVIVAMLVLPVEGYLRNLMLRSLDSSGKFYQFIVPKKNTLPLKEEPEAFMKEPSEVDD